MEPCFDLVIVHPWQNIEGEQLRALNHTWRLLYLRYWIRGVTIPPLKQGIKGKEAEIVCKLFMGEYLKAYGLS